MVLRDVIAGIVLLLVAAGYALAIGTIPDRSLPNTPGPSFFPYLIAAALAVLSAALLIQGLVGLRAGSDETKAEKLIDVDGREAVALIWFAIYLAVLPYTGFKAATIPFFAGLMLLYGARSPVLVIAGSLAVPLALDAIFRHAFSILLPAGIW